MKKFALARLYAHLRLFYLCIYTSFCVFKEMLGVKKAKFIQTLIDMLELDTSDHVRTMVILIKCKALQN
jgi:hypothetical protein